MYTLRTKPSYSVLATALILVAGLGLSGKFLRRYEVQADRNALAKSRSPFLKTSKSHFIQWMEWGPEVFQAAKRRDVPIYIDIGVFWNRLCGRMNGEINVDSQLAQYLNDHFVCVKIDAEQEPAVAASFLRQARTLGGSADWPLVAVADHRGAIFRVATWDQDLSIEQLYAWLQDARELWAQNRAEVTRLADTTLAAEQESIVSAEHRPAAPEPEVLAAMTEKLFQRYDAQYGGFGIPRQEGKGVDGPALLFLLDRAERDKDADSKQKLRFCLDTLRDSALHDWVNGGFHLSSSDRARKLPDFAKHIALNAQLLEIYARAAKLFNDESYRKIAGEIVDFIQTTLWDDMEAKVFTSVSYGLSPSERGAYYAWSLSQLNTVCTPTEIAALRYRFGLDEEGSIRWDTSLRVFHVSASFAQIASKMGISEASVRSLIEDALGNLQDARDRRALLPPVDRSVHTDLNGLAAYSFAVAGKALGNDNLVSMGDRVIQHLLDFKKEPDGLLNHGLSTATGLLADQVWPALASVAVYRANGDPERLRFAEAIAGALQRRFEDRTGWWGLWMRATDKALAEAAPIESMRLAPIERGMIPFKPIYDTLYMSDNAASALLMIDLYEVTKNPEYWETARRILFAFGKKLEEGDPAQVGMMIPLNRFLEAKR